MKSTLLTAFLVIALFSLHFAMAQNAPRVKHNGPHPKWMAKNPFEQKVFIENKGQFEPQNTVNPKDILFGARQGGLQYYFTPTAIYLSRLVLVKRSEKEIEQIREKMGTKEDNDNDGDDGADYKRVEQFHSMMFDGANFNATITASDEVRWYYNYTAKEHVNIIAHAWEEITYNDLYPGIDMVIHFPKDNSISGKDNSESGSFEYSFIIHPGADISQIKIKYNGEVKLNPDGTVTIKSAYGNFTEYTPTAKLQTSNDAINCNFSFHNGHLNFNAENYNNNETLLIDPLVITPTFSGSPNSAYDVDWDDAGNIYAYGGSYPWQILKYNDKGTLLWNYTTEFDGNGIYMGDFAVNRGSQSVFVTEGVDDGSGGAEVYKLNQQGTEIAIYAGNDNFTEMWKIGFSLCSNEAVIAGGGRSAPSFTASYLDTDLTNLDLVNTLNDQTAGYHDMWGLAIDDFGNAYMITAHSHGSQPNSFDNDILKLPLPKLAPTTWLVPSNYNFLEINSLTYNAPQFNDGGMSSNGYNGMSVSDTTLYTYDSYVLKRWRTSNGKLIDSLLINGTSRDDSISWGGLATDDCGDIFLGSNDTVKQYSNDLKLVNFYVEPGTVYDVKLSLSDTIYVSGIGFISDTGITLPPCHIIKTTNDIHNVTCDSLGSATLSSPTGGTPPYTVVWNTNPVITGDTATSLKKGTYIATISDSSCPRQVYADTIKILGPLKLSLSSNTDTVCQGVPVTITVVGGYNYTWSPSTGLNTSTGSNVIATLTATTTYTVIGTVSAGGCLDTEAVVINVHPLPSIAIQPSQPAICFGQSISLTGSGASTYLWNPKTGLSSDSISKVTANPTITTTYTLYGTSVYGCEDSNKVVVTVNPIPVVKVSPPSTIVCVGKSISLSASGATTYDWSPSTGLNSTSNSTVTASPTINSTYTVIGTSLGCSDTTTVPIRVIQDSLKVSPTTTTVCQGNSALLTSAGADNYAWSPSSGLNHTTGDTVTATPTTTTTYTLVGSGVNDCTDTLKVVVNVNLPPVLTIAPPTPQICIGKSIALSVSGASTYSWSPSTGLSNTTGSGVTANPTVTTTYTAYGTDAQGCNDSTKVVVTVNPLPVVTVTPPSTIICNGSSVSLTANGASTYQWNPSTGLSTTSNSSVSANPTINSTYTVYGTDVLGCIDTTTVAVRVIQDSLKVSTDNPFICQGNSILITASGASDYVWTPSTGLSQTSGSSVTANPTTTTTYTLIASGDNGCPDTTTIVVNVNLPPVLTIAPASPQICIYRSTPLTVSGASTYTWSPSAGLSQTSGSSITASPTVTTTYTAYGTDVNGCNDSAKVVIVVNPLPHVTAVASMDTICHGLSVTLTANGATSYQWSPTTGLSSSTNAVVQADPTITTTYSVYGTDNLGCIDTAMVTVNIIPNSIKILLFPVNSIVCLGDSASLSATGGTNYAWSPSTALSATSGSMVISKPTTATTYTVIGVGTGDCADTTVAVISVSPPPVITVTPSAPIICDGQSILLTASGGTRYIWYPSSGLSNSTGSSITANPNTTSTYTLYGSDSLECVDSAKFTLTVDSNPIGAFTFNIPSICYPLQIQLSNSSSGGASYLWNFGDGSTSTEMNPSHEYSKQGDYKITLIVTSANGCTDTVTTTDTSSNYTAGVFIPSSFTPTVPGVNQIFRPNVECSGPVNYLFRVYDRWGEMMYETHDPSDGWDGIFNGKIQPLDVYVYYVEFTCGTCSFFKKGNVTLLK